MPLIPINSSNFFMKHPYFLSLCFVFATTMATLQAQEPTERKVAAAAAVGNLNASEILELYKQNHQRAPALPPSSKALWPNKRTSSGTETTQLPMPPSFRVPGEFEEVQAIFLTWPYITLDTLNNPSFQWFPNLGPYYGANSTFLGLGPVTNVVDTFSNSPFPAIYKQLVMGIEPEAAVWMNIWEAQDSVAIKAYMAAQGAPLTNTRFFVNPGNSIWYRDCGPVGFYYGTADSLAFLDFEYYGERPLDDVLPIHLGAATGYPVYTTTIENEGGNVLVDGVGTLFTTTTVNLNNGDTWGPSFLANPANPASLTWTTKTPLSPALVRDSLLHLLHLDRAFVLPALRFDGGTGHIDLYADMWDENTFVFTRHPEGMRGNIDVTIVANNVATLTSQNSYHSVPYLGTSIPLPTKDDGSWYTSGADYNNYTRTYSNHLIVNKSIIQPVYSDGITGNVVGTLADLEILRAKYPGYNIIPIDKRAFDGFGGSIHCITKQVPAENPLLLLHLPVRGVHQTTVFAIEAEARNHSGVANATLTWRVKGGAWVTVPLAEVNGKWQGNIVGNPAAVADTIEYFVTATSNNGKTVSKPFTAPDGFYTFAHGTSYVSVANNGAPNFGLGAFAPNPATDYSKLELVVPENTQLTVQVFDGAGRIIHTTKTQGATFELATANLPQGLYFIQFSHENGYTTFRKLLVQ